MELNKCKEDKKKLIIDELAYCKCECDNECEKFKSTQKNMCVGLQ
jgi:hypothetical protein